MIAKLKQISEILFEIDEQTFPGMKVPARVFASRQMLSQVGRDRSLNQLVNVTYLPGILEHAVVMPDVHEGYGFPIGGVAAIDYEEGVISPGGIGYDINCGVRLLKTDMNYREINPVLKDLSEEINRKVPSGVGRGGGLKLNSDELDKVLKNGAGRIIEIGYGNEEDLMYMESGGCLYEADPSAVSEKAKQRGLDQLGTMGAGNHFVEVDRINEILDQDVAEIFGLFKGQAVIQIHTGSRGLGHQTASDYIRQIIGSSKSFGFDLPDRELSCAPFNSFLGSAYFSAMCAAANYAWANRQMITQEVREAWREIFGSSSKQPTLFYDVAHNIAKIEQPTVSGKNKKVIVHRKGATRAFPAGHKDVPEKYRKAGQPVLIPGSMGTSSYVLCGLPGSMENSFGSCCHGAGRTMSRTKARKSVSGQDLLRELSGMGIEVQARSFRGISEEAPQAYKDVNIVVDVVEQAGIAKRVARLKPMAVVKG